MNHDGNKITTDEVRSDNRELMPEFTKAYDSLTEAFGQIKVIYAQENDRVVGVEPDESEYVTIFVEPKAIGDSWGRIKR
jgi:putative heme iron utilization protein